MRVDEVQNTVKAFPALRRKAQVLYDLIRGHELTSILELGFRDGQLTTFLAGAIEEGSGAEITALDVNKDQAEAEGLLESCGLRQLVKFQSVPSLSWALLQLLQAGRTFDLCLIGVRHTWEDTSLAFSLASHLVRPGGWIILQDLGFSFRNSAAMNAPWVRAMSESEQVTAQVEQVFSLLVQRDPGFDTFRRIFNLGIARKKAQGETTLSLPLQVETELCDAARRCHTDASYRQSLIHAPAHALATMMKRPESVYRNLRIAESDLYAPLAPVIENNGITTHYIERPKWDKRFKEEELLAMLA